MPASNKQPFGPLAGVKVLDLTMYMAGPTCGLMLADLGADVIKLEKIPGGDDARRLTPPTIGEHAASFMVMNRNKRGIAVDLKKPEGVRVLKRLAASADILIENFRPGTLEKLGVGYDVLSKENPGLDLRLDLRLRQHRPACRSSRPRSHRAGLQRPDEHHRRRPGTAARQSRRAG